MSEFAVSLAVGGGTMPPHRRGMEIAAGLFLKAGRIVAKVWKLC